MEVDSSVLLIYGRHIMEEKPTVLNSLLPVMTMTPLNWFVQPVPMSEEVLYRYVRMTLYAVCWLCYRPLSYTIMYRRSARDTLLLWYGKWITGL